MLVVNQSEVDAGGHGGPGHFLRTDPVRAHHQGDYREPDARLPRMGSTTSSPEIQTWAHQGQRLDETIAQTSSTLAL